MAQIGKPLHVGISVLDMEESIAWYEKNLGFRLVKDDGFRPPLGGRICCLEQDGFQLELCRYEEPVPLPEERKSPNTDLRQVGTKHLALAVTGMEALKARFAENGVETALETEMHGEHVLFIRDCSGVLIELIEA